MDDEHLHWSACREIVAPLGIRLSRARYDARYLAFDDRTALRAILRDARVRPGGRRAGARVPGLDDLVRRKRRRFRLLCEARGVRIASGAAALVRALARRVPLAIVSGAARREVLRALERARIRPLFRTIVTAETVRRSKPDPEGYRLALRRLGTSPGEGNVAIEDSPGGIRAARAAGLRVIGVTTSYGPEVLRRAGAGRTAPALASLSAARVLGGGAPFRVKGARTPRRRRRSCG
jgi:beta-phosphoglucomutase